MNFWPMRHFVMTIAKARKKISAQRTSMKIFFPMNPLNWIDQNLSKSWTSVLIFKIFGSIQLFFNLWLNEYIFGQKKFAKIFFLIFRQFFKKCRKWKKNFIRSGGTLDTFLKFCYSHDKMSHGSKVHFDAGAYNFFLQSLVLDA